MKIKEILFFEQTSLIPYNPNNKNVVSYNKDTKNKESKKLEIIPSPSSPSSPSSLLKNKENILKYKKKIDLRGLIKDIKV